MRNEISQLAQAIQAFKTDFQVSYIPSRITLPPAQSNMAGYDVTGESLQYITTLWPRINQVALGTTPQAFQFWGVPGSTPVTLTGDQVLVFFLGGVRDANNNCFGFSTSPLNPTTGPATGGEARKGPYFEFPPGRLAAVNHTPSNPSLSATDIAYPSFIDVYGTMPYVYFSTRKTANDYPTFTSSSAGYQVYPTQLVVSGATYTIYPYQISGPAPNGPSTAIRVWANKSGFQIVAAGRDGLFCDPSNYAGGLNWPSAGGAIDLPGYDNMSNFHPTLLGITAQ
jgi:hypothetical protein